MGAHLKRTIQIEFVNQEGLTEAGIDGGGLFKEFLNAMAAQVSVPHIISLALLPPSVPPSLPPSLPPSVRPSLPSSRPPSPFPPTLPPILPPTHPPLRPLSLSLCGWMERERAQIERRSVRIAVSSRARYTHAHTHVYIHIYICTCIIQAFHPKYGLFKSTEQALLFPNPQVHAYANMMIVLSIALF